MSQSSATLGVKFVYGALAADIATMAGFMLGYQSKGDPLIPIEMAIGLAQVLIGGTAIFFLWTRRRHAKGVVIGCLVWRVIARVFTLFTVGPNASSDSNAHQVEMILLLGIALVCALLSTSFRRYLAVADTPSVEKRP